MSTDWAAGSGPSASTGLYTDRDVFARDGAVFGGTWTYLAHESEIPQPNDFVRRRLGLRPVIVTRDRDGRCTRLLNRCTHRGATVCRVDAGNAPRFVCPYHNWTFDNTGKLVGVPVRRGLRRPGVRRRRRSTSAGCAWRATAGFVFGALDAALPPLEEHLGHAARLIDQWIDRWPGGAVVVRHGSAPAWTYRGNWKLAWTTPPTATTPASRTPRCCGCARTATAAGVDMQWTLGDVDAGLQTVTDLGNGHTFLDQRAEIDSYWAQSAPMPGEQSYEALLRERLGDDAAAAALEVAVGSGMNLNIFPNLLIIGNQIQVVEPYDVDDTHLVWYATSLEAPDLPPEITALRMRLQEDFPSFGEPDDLANFEECHAGLLDPRDGVGRHRPPPRHRPRDPRRARPPHRPRVRRAADPRLLGALAGAHGVDDEAGRRCERSPGCDPLRRASCATRSTSTYVDDAYYALLRADVARVGRAAARRSPRPSGRPTRRWSCTSRGCSTGAGSRTGTASTRASACTGCPPPTPSPTRPGPTRATGSRSPATTGGASATASSGCAPASPTPSCRPRTPRTCRRASSGCPPPARARSRSARTPSSTRSAPATSCRRMAGWTGHVLVEEDGGWRIARKTVALLDAERAHHNLTFLL